jgi:hypothetical protein
MRQLVQELERAEKVAEELANTTEGRRMTQLGQEFQARKVATTGMEDLNAEIDGRTRLIGLTENQARVQKLLNDIRKAGGGQDTPALLDAEAQARDKLAALNDVSGKEFATSQTQMRREAGLTANEIKALNRFLDDSDIAMFAVRMGQAHLTDTWVKGQEVAKTLREEIQNFGKTAAQVAANDLDAFGKTTEANNIRQQEATLAQMKLNKELAVFQLTVSGATQAQVAYAKANDSVSGAQAYQQSLLQQALKVRQDTMTPAEQLAETERNLAEVYQAGLISITQYNLALEKHWQQLAKIQEIGSGKVFMNQPGSLAAALMTQAETLRGHGPFNVPPPQLGPTQFNAPATANQQLLDQKRAADYLQEILALMQKGGGPGQAVLPLNLNRV